MARHGEAGRGEYWQAWLGKERRGSAWFGGFWYGRRGGFRHGATRLGRSGQAWRVPAWLGEAWRGEYWQARRGESWPGPSRDVLAWQASLGMVRPVAACCGMARFYFYLWRIE